MSKETPAELQVEAFEPENLPLKDYPLLLQCNIGQLKELDKLLATQRSQAVREELEHIHSLYGQKSLPEAAMAMDSYATHRIAELTKPEQPND